MRFVKYLCLAAALAMVGWLGVGAQANTYSYRQYYSGWHHYPKYNYYYRYYYYKPTPNYYGYKYNYTIYYPSRPKYYYWYNQYAGKYYGRCPVDYGGKPLYSWLKPEDQGPELSTIPDNKFPVPDGRTTPPIPETRAENEPNGEVPRMDLPPGEPPTGVAGLPIGE
jgi:hypothetical protein